MKLSYYYNVCIGHNNIQFNQPHSAYMYNHKMNGVDRHYQPRTSYSLERDGAKSWKHIF